MSGSEARVLGQCLLTKKSEAQDAIKKNPKSNQIPKYISARSHLLNKVKRSLFLRCKGPKKVWLAESAILLPSSSFLNVKLLTWRNAVPQNKMYVGKLDLNKNYHFNRTEFYLTNQVLTNNYDILHRNPKKATLNFIILACAVDRGYKTIFTKGIL